MKQYNEQFARLYMIPLMAEILTDMGNHFGSFSQAESAEKKGDYLQKLLMPAHQRRAADILTIEEKKRFRDEYFPAIQQATRPFTGNTPQDEESRQAILETLMQEVQRRIQLAGVEGVKAALLPSQTRSFGDSEALTRNLYRLAWTVAMNLKQGVPSSSQSEILQSTPQIPEVSVEEIVEIMKLLEEAGLEVVPLEPSAQTVQPGQPSLQPGQKWPQMVEPMAGGALRIFGMAELQPDGTARIRVLDKDSQELEVIVNTKATNDDPGKFTFRFEGGENSGKTFSVSQSQLKEKFKDAETGKPNSAAQVYNKLPTEQTASPQAQQLSPLPQPQKKTPPQAQSQPPPTPPLPSPPRTSPTETPAFTLAQKPQRIPTETLAAPSPKSVSESTSTPTSTFQPVEQTRQSSFVHGSNSQPIRLPEKSLIREPFGTSVMQKKRALQQKKRLTEGQTPEDQKGEQEQQEQQPEWSNQYAGMQQQQGRTRLKKRKKKGRWLKRAAVGATAGGVVGSIWYPVHEAIFALATPRAEMVHCLGLICLG